MPTTPAEIIPLLVMPPSNVEIVIVAVLRVTPPTVTVPPIRMPSLAAVIVPALVMPPPKVAIVTDAVLLAPRLTLA
ncbi:MAG: hypothetical protein WBF27_23365 [Xanthobacteraceae bacterium]